MKSSARGRVWALPSPWWRAYCWPDDCGSLQLIRMSPGPQIKHRTFWVDTVEMPKPRPLALPAKVDVAIVGAGFTGLSAARTLAKKGVNTAVLEAETVGWGASSRNGGMVLPGLKLSVNTLYK